MTSAIDARASDARGASLSTIKLDPAVQGSRSQSFGSESDGSIFSWGDDDAQENADCERAMAIPMSGTKTYRSSPAAANASYELAQLLGLPIPQPAIVSIAIKQATTPRPKHLFRTSLSLSRFANSFSCSRCFDAIANAALIVNLLPDYLWTALFICRLLKNLRGKAREVR